MSTTQRSERFAATRTVRALCGRVLSVSLLLAPAWLTCACTSASRNPSPEDLRPVPPKSAANAPAAAISAGSADSATAPPSPAPNGAAESTTAKPAAPLDAKKADAQIADAKAQGAPLPIATVATEVIDVRSFLVRTWLRSTNDARETLDLLVVERLALLEAERTGVTIDPSQVDLRVDEAWKALERKLADTRAGLTAEEHLKRELGLDPEVYRRELRREAIAQLIAERVVRSWSMDHERAVVRLAELEDKETLRKFQEGLAAGRAFTDLTKEFHQSRAKEPEGARLTLIRSETTPLARLAFAAEVGAVTGPLQQGERAVMLLVEKRLPPVSGDWAKVGALVEASLIDTPVDDFEYMQWRGEMVHTYPVDVDPFFKLIGVTR